MIYAPDMNAILRAQFGEWEEEKRLAHYELLNRQGEPAPTQEDLGGNTMAQEPTMEQLIRGKFHEWAVEQQQYHEEIQRRMSEPSPKPGEIPVTLRMPAYLEEHLNYDPNTPMEEPTTDTDQLLRSQLLG